MTAELLRLLLESLRDPVFSQLRSSPWSFLAESPPFRNHQEGSEESWWEIFCPLVARTVAQQINHAVENAKAAFQCAVTTRAGMECAAHVVQTLTDVDDTTMVPSVDGVGAFDLCGRSREATLLCVPVQQLRFHLHHGGLPWRDSRHRPW